LLVPLGDAVEPSPLGVCSGIRRVDPDCGSEQLFDLAVEFQRPLEQFDGFREAISVDGQLLLVEYRPAAHG
jgi:hypothetical protein